jgi:hypothetical protein
MGYLFPNDFCWWWGDNLFSFKKENKSIE